MDAIINFFSSVLSFIYAVFSAVIWLAIVAMISIVYAIIINKISRNYSQKIHKIISIISSIIIATIIYICANIFEAHQPSFAREFTSNDAQAGDGLGAGGHSDSGGGVLDFFENRRVFDITDNYHEAMQIVCDGNLVIWSYLGNYEKGISQYPNVIEAKDYFLEKEISYQEVNDADRLNNPGLSRRASVSYRIYSNLFREDNFEWKQWGVVGDANSAVPIETQVFDLQKINGEWSIARAFDLESYEFEIGKLSRFMQNPESHRLRDCAVARAPAENADHLFGYVSPAPQSDGYHGSSGFRKGNGPS